MSSVGRWSPISDLRSLQSAVDRLWRDTFGMAGPSRTVGAVGEGYLPLDVYQTDKEWVVRAAVPGIDPNAGAVLAAGELLWEVQPPGNAPRGRRWRAGEGAVRERRADPDGGQGAAGQAEVGEDSDLGWDGERQR